MKPTITARMDFALDRGPGAAPLGVQLDALHRELQRWLGLGGWVQSLRILVWGGLLTDEEERHTRNNLVREGWPSPVIEITPTPPANLVTLIVEPADLPEPLHQLLDIQREAFARRWGRPFKAGDPLFFDPLAPKPQWLEDERLWDAVVEACRIHRLNPIWVAALLGYPILAQDVEK